MDVGGDVDDNRWRRWTWRWWSRSVGCWTFSFHSSAQQSATSALPTVQATLKCRSSCHQFSSAWRHRRTRRGEAACVCPFRIQNSFFSVLSDRQHTCASDTVPTLIVSDWTKTPTGSGGCTLTPLVDWSWRLPGSVRAFKQAALKHGSCDREINT